MDLFDSYANLFSSKKPAEHSFMKNPIPSHFDNPLLQNFSFPDSLICYISCSSANVLQKMNKTCKYFFVNNQVMDITSMQARYFTKEWKVKLNGKEITNFHQLPCKIWLTEKLNIYISDIALENNDGNNTFNQNFFTFIIPKIFKSNIKNLSLNEQNISFNDFVFVASKCEEIFIYNSTVKFSDGSIVAVEKIVQVLPQIKNFFFRIFYPNSITSTTVQELLKIPHFLMIDKFSLQNISQDFDIQNFFAHIKTNTKTKWMLTFCNEISEEYKNRLHEIVNEIVETENHIYEVPFIVFPGIDLSTYKIIQDLSLIKMKQDKFVTVYTW